MRQQVECLLLAFSSSVEVLLMCSTAFRPLERPQSRGFRSPMQSGLFRGPQLLENFQFPSSSDMPNSGTRDHLMEDTVLQPDQAWGRGMGWFPYDPSAFYLLCTLFLI